MNGNLINKKDESFDESYKNEDINCHGLCIEIGRIIERAQSIILGLDYYLDQWDKHGHPPIYTFEDLKLIGDILANRVDKDMFH